MGLILGIIGILVIAAGIGATAYYGGDSYTDSVLKGEATESISQAEQITTMIQIYKVNEKQSPADLSTITSDPYYNRTQSDMGWSYDATANTAYKAMESEQYCETVNEEMGYTGSAPSCSSVPAELADRKYYCCVN